MPSARSTVRMVSSLAKTAGWLAAVTAHQRLVADDEQYELFQRYMQRWSRVIIATAGAEVLLTPESVVPARHGARIIVANHRSPLDILILLGIFGGHALSRKDLAGWPIIGVAARRAGTIFVDRDSAQSGASAIREIRSRLKEGKSVLVFPEGGTFRGDEVRPFEAGIFTAMSGRRLRARHGVGRRVVRRARAARRTEARHARGRAHRLTPNGEQAHRPAARRAASGRAAARESCARLLAAHVSGCRGLSRSASHATHTIPPKLQAPFVQGVTFAFPPL
jgi:1-acyl-sn-glycerol-3-phosphate acyltransferase